MQTEVTSFWEWQQRYSDEKSCIEALIELRWGKRFSCKSCSHQKGWLIRDRAVYECLSCHHQTSVTAGALFHNTKLTLVKWFWCIYWLSSDKLNLIGQ